MVCLMRKANPDAELHTFTVGYGADDPELVTAARVARAMDTVHHEIIAGADLLETDLPTLVWHLEDPIARSETLQLYAVARLAGPHVDVLLSGYAADGLFLGMPKHKLLWAMQKTPFFRQPLADLYHFSQVGLPPQSLLGSMLCRLYYQGSLPPIPRILGADQAITPAAFPVRSGEFGNTIAAASFRDEVARNAQKFERPFAAWGLSHGSPFYDPNLVKLAFSIPERLKIRNGNGKYILRKALESIVPNEFLNRPKFAQRMHYDLTFSVAFDELIDRHLSPERVADRGFFDYADIEALRERKANQSYRPETAMRLWTILLTELWATEFIDRRGAGPAEHQFEWADLPTRLFVKG
jgi:asparagine synthase (glutamine-hydrolysing)